LFNLFTEKWINNVLHVEKRKKVISLNVPIVALLVTAPKSAGKLTGKSINNTAKCTKKTVMTNMESTWLQGEISSLVFIT